LIRHQKPKPANSDGVVLCVPSDQRLIENLPLPSIQTDSFFYNRQKFR
jgi:hypothetical protein